MAETGRRVVVAGESLIDRLVRPDGGVEDVVGGGPFTTARALARLGLPVSFVGGLSTDASGARLRAALAADGVDLSLAVTTEAPTLLAIAALDAAGVASYRFEPAGSAAASLRPADLARGLPPDTAVLHVGTLGLVLEPVAEVIAGLISTALPDVLVVVDPNLRPSAIEDAAVYRERLAKVIGRADVVRASHDDLAWLAPDRSIEDTAMRIVGAGPSLLLLTEGAGPVRIVTGHGVRVVPVPAVRVVDTVGAGDAFGAGFLAAWLGGSRDRGALRDIDAVETAVRFAIRVASWTVGRPGAALPTRADLGLPNLSGLD
ncbi:MAG TPA: PfkB family carbohydrate kinase [Candidatus Limnocylindrales bacterium]